MSEMGNSELSFDGDRFALAQCDSDFLVDIVDEDGIVRWMSASQSELLGIADTDMRQVSIETVYDGTSVEKIRAMLGRNAGIGFAATLELRMFGRAGRAIRTVARATIVADGGERALRLSKIEFGQVGSHYDQLTADFMLLSNIIRHAKEAHWAIVFLEPVDTTQGRDEIIRQVFENQSVWRMCNPALSRLYGLPEDMDLSTQSVRLYWPRSPENEAFVGHIIDGSYSVDDAVSVDRKHDGTSLYVSNDVRADIVDGFLIRLWGNIRNVTELSEAKQKLYDGEGGGQL
ncbi:hypothetical protein JQ617_24575 [Bradyrhizobium sp. KB893862 SZCCT0404]|uniref:hypothetical protein n=1 Tax=Bradyrhizobium sp. KB893862 SZCCT0404 TaxID=2807672 RepID=UPI001BA777C3|nr:hypothetical protein [Bradyrhizobium sp. KB893862 SZCCT0404]MBR1177150.1 hypothetical protein [Bradyrhizobium sp. KB893862 SZCCT0404]